MQAAGVDIPPPPRADAGWGLPVARAHKTDRCRGIEGVDCWGKKRSGGQSWGHWRAHKGRWAREVMREVRERGRCGSAAEAVHAGLPGRS